MYSASLGRLQQKMVPPLSSPDDGVAVPAPLIGAEELLLWVSDVLGDIGEEVDFSSLRFGHIFLHLFNLIWPEVFQEAPHAGCLQPETTADVSANWELLQWALQRVGVPLSFLNPSGVCAGDFAACYQALVLLFFLFCLAKNHECEFVLAHPVDPQLTEFMSSEAPLACLIAGGAVRVSENLREKIMTPKTIRTATAEAAPGDGHSMQQQLPATAIGRSSHTQEYSNAHIRERIRRPVQQQQPKQQQQQNKQQQQQHQQKQHLGGSSLVKEEGLVDALPAAFKPTGVPPVIVGGAFNSDGTFCVETVAAAPGGAAGAGAADTNGPGNKTHNNSGNTKDVEVQTSGSVGPLQPQEWQLLPQQLLSVDWSGEGQKVKGEQLVELLRYQNELLQQQLQQAEEAAAAARRLHQQQLRDAREAAAVALQREKEKCNAEVLQQQTQHAAAVQAMWRQLDLRLHHIEDDMAVDVEVLSASSCLKTETKPNQKPSMQGPSSAAASVEAAAAAAPAAASVGEESSQCSGEQPTALARVKKLEALMEERLRARDAAASEVKQLMQEALQRCAEYKRESDSRWEEWRRCEDLRSCLLQLLPDAEPKGPKRSGVSAAAATTAGAASAATADSGGSVAAARQALNERLRALLDRTGCMRPVASVTEQHLLSALVECLCMQQVQQAQHRQAHLELLRLSHQQQQAHQQAQQKQQHLQGSVSGAFKAGGGTNMESMQRELLLEEKVRRLEVRNQRLLRTSEYLRLKVEHVQKWKAEDAFFTNSQVHKRLEDASDTQEGQEATGNGKAPHAAETQQQLQQQRREQLVSWLAQEDTADAIDRDSELLQLLKTLHRHPKTTFGEEAEAETRANSAETEETERCTSLSVYPETKKRLLELFWLLLGDFYRFKARLEEGRHQLQQMQAELRFAVQEKLAALQAAEEDRRALLCAFEKKLHSDRTAANKTIGKTVVKLLVAQEEAETLQRGKKRQEEEHDALVQVFYQTDKRRFNAVLTKLEAVQRQNCVLQKREEFWNDLTKALSMQLTRPSESTQQAIQNLWAQLVGSKALMETNNLVADIYISPFSLLLQDAHKTDGEGSDQAAKTLSPRQNGSAFGAAATATAAARAVLRSTSRLSNRNPSSSTKATAAATTAGGAGGTAAKTSSKARGASPALQGRTPRGVAAAAAASAGDSGAATPAATAAEMWSAADSFTRCLREICSQNNTTGASNICCKNPSAAASPKAEGGRGSESWSAASEPDSELSELKRLEGKYVFTSDSGETTHSVTKETRDEMTSNDKMPSDWLRVLKLMTQEATALLQKHKEIKENEIEELKREREGQIEKNKQLMQQLSEFHVQWASLREQHEFLQRQHQLSLEALKRAHADRLQTEKLRRDAEEELKTEISKFRINEKEAKKIISAVAAHAGNVPYIQTLCNAFLAGATDPAAATAAPAAVTAADAFKDSKTGGLHPKPTTLEELGTEEAANGELPTTTPDKRNSTLQMQGDPEETLRALADPPSASAFSPSPSPPQHLLPVDDEFIKPKIDGRISKEQAGGPQQHRKQRSVAPPEFDGSAAHVTESPALISLIQCAAPNKDKQQQMQQQRKKQQQQQQQRKQRQHGFLYAESNTVAAAAEAAAADVMTSSSTWNALGSTEEVDTSGSRSSSSSSSFCADDFNRLSSTALPTPRSPPRAALAPLVSPSRLVQALRKQAMSADPESSSSSSRSSSSRSSSSSRRLVSGIEKPLRSPDSPASGDDAKEEAQYKQTEKEINNNEREKTDKHRERQATDTAEAHLLTNGQLGNTPAKDPSTAAAIPGGDDQQKFESGRYQTRAAAERAWEAFVGEYRHPTRSLQQQSFSSDKRTQAWLVRGGGSSGNSSSNSISSSRESAQSTLLSQGMEEGEAAVAAALIRLQQQQKQQQEQQQGSLLLPPTRESTDSALEDLLHLEQRLCGEASEEREGEDIGVCLTDLKAEQTEDPFIADDCHQLGISASAFLKRLGTQLENRMRISCKRQERRS